MFDFVRKHTKVMQFLLFLLIFPSFVLFGLEGYNRFKDQGEPVAKVDGKEIMQGEWDTAHKTEVDRLRTSMPSLDAKVFDTPSARYATLERLVRERVLAAAAVQGRFTASDQRLAQELEQNESIAQLRQGGKLDMDRYRQLVGSQGMTPQMFEAQVRADLTVRQVLEGISGTGFAQAVPARRALDAYFEKREVQVARFNASDYAAKVNPTDAELEAFYKENGALFQAPEQANIEYLVLDLETVKKNITIKDQDLNTYYEQNKERLAGQEERRASHILIGSPKSAPEAERQKARARAAELLAAARKAPDSFADLAKKNSQDTGSAVNGGDLDFFRRGAMTKPFEEAVFAMKKGDISDLVESEFGYHIIKLTDIKTPKPRAFEELRPGIEADLKKQQAQRTFTESADAFSNGVYEQADSLKPVADRLKLDVRTATNVMRKPAADAQGPLANPKFLAALFSPDAVEKKRNTEAIETASNQLVSGRITQYTPARTLPFADVKDKVRERLVARRGAELAKKEGMEKLAAWKAKPTDAVLSVAVAVSREEAQKQPAAVVEAALRADPAALPALVGVDMGSQGYAVVMVNKVLTREAPTQDNARREGAQYSQWWSSAESLAYYNALKERFKVQIKVAKPARAAEGQTQAQ